MRADVTPGKDVLQVLEEFGVDRHHVLEVAVDRAILYHEDLAVALDDLRLDLAGTRIVEDVNRGLAVEDLLADFGDALRAQGVGVAGPAEGRFGLLPRLQERLVRPLRRE